MRRILFISLAILFFAGICHAASIPTGVDPKNYPEVWTQTVYNGSGSEIISGYVVQWDYDTSDSTENWYDDMCPWVKKVDADDDIWTAGVVVYGRNIADKSYGDIVIKGPTYVVAGATNAENTLSGAEGTYGGARSFDVGTDTCSLGRCIQDNLAYGPNGDAGAVTLPANTEDVGFILVDVDVDCSD